MKDQNQKIHGIPLSEWYHVKVGNSGWDGNQHFEEFFIVAKTSHEAKRKIKPFIHKSLHKYIVASNMKSYTGTCETNYSYLYLDKSSYLNSIEYLKKLDLASTNKGHSIYDEEGETIEVQDLDKKMNQAQVYYWCSYS
jgi:hypothetical protein